MTPIELACSHQFPDKTNCGKEAGEPCRDMPIGTFHDERWAAAGAQTVDQGDIPSKEDFDKIIESYSEVF